MIFTLRTTVGRENAVMEALSSRVKNLHTNVQSILHPSEVKGYLFVEGDLDAIERSISGVPHVRGMIKKEVSVEELRKFIETKKIDITIAYGDIVEITEGPFKNERGRVTRVDEAKEEVTLELLEASIPIPTTVSLDSIRVVESRNKEGESSG